MEIVLRALVIFLFLWGITRIVGRSTLGELSAFELILFITMGDLVQQAVTQQDYSITGAMLGVGTFAALTILLSWLNSRWKKTHPIVHGVPVVVCSDGEPILDTMRRERLAMDDFMGAARQQGIEKFAEIRLAVLESNGQISFFTSDSASAGAPPPPKTG